MTTEYKNLIDGELITNGQWLDVINPANEEVIGKVPACGEAELNRAVAAARRAFKTWSKTSVEERSAVLHAIADAIEENFDELFRLLTMEQGKPQAQAQAGKKDPRGAVCENPESTEPHEVPAV